MYDGLLDGKGVLSVLQLRTGRCLPHLLPRSSSLFSQQLPELQRAPGIPTLCWGHSLHPSPGSQTPINIPPFPILTPSVPARGPICSCFPVLVVVPFGNVEVEPTSACLNGLLVTMDSLIVSDCICSVLRYFSRVVSSSQFRQFKWFMLIFRHPKRIITCYTLIDSLIHPTTQ